MLILMVQVIIQLRKFAQAAKRIKAAVGTEASTPQLAKAVTKGDVNPGDLSDIIGTEIRDGMDTSAFGELELLADQSCTLQPIAHADHVLIVQESCGGCSLLYW